MPARRFNVYRNNIYAGLIRVIEARYPAVLRLVGFEFFKATARLFIDRFPPRSPVLLEYGADFPGFLELFEPVSDVPYLPDVARLEWRMHAARHAADCIALRASDLAALSDDCAADVVLTLAPAVSLVDSPYPVFSIWRANSSGSVEHGEQSFSGPESVLVTRPDLAAEAIRIPRGAAMSIAALREGASLGAAAVATADGHDFPLQRTIALLIAQRAIEFRTLHSRQNAGEKLMTPWISRFHDALAEIPHDLIAIVGRVAIGTVFWRSAMTKIDGLALKPSTFFLFENDYRLPLIPPEAAAYLATATELTMPLLLWSGLLTRVAATVLLAMTLVIEIFVYPNAFDTHGVWAVTLLYLMKFGPGRFSLDHLLGGALRYASTPPGR